MALLKRFLSSLTGKKVLIATHAGADIDALSAAAALSEALGPEFKSQILVPEHANLNAKQLAKNLSIPFTSSFPEKEFNGIIVVDLNEWSRLGSFKEKIRAAGKPVLLIDHHSDSNEGLALKEFSLIKENAASSTEVLLDLFRDEKIEITPRIALLLACGILTDSVSLMVASPKTLRNMAELLEKCGKELSELVGLFEVKTDLSEKIARLKAAKRARVFLLGESIVVTTEVGAFEATAAGFLMRLGADVAFAGDCEKGVFRLSGRASAKFLKENDFDLAKDVFIELEKSFKGSGGGHKGAAAFNGKAESLSLVLNKSVQLVHEFLKKKNPKIKVKEYT